MKKSLYLIFSLFLTTYLIGAEEESKTLKIGNLALKTSQQPGPLVSFGENIVEKGDVQLFLFGDLYQRRNGHFIDVMPSILWGVTDEFSIFYNLPMAPSYKERKNHSSGFEDAFIQFEYAFLSKEEKTFTETATIVFNVAIPTGSTSLTPITGYGAPSCFIGTTYNHTSIDWFYFASIGSILTSSTKKNTKIGSQLLYECGFGRNIPSPEGWIFAWMIEFDGYYLLRNRFQGDLDCNSGGNIMYLTPSLWASTEKFIFQLGLGAPLYQRLYGNQLSYLYQAFFNVGYTF